MSSQIYDLRPQFDPRASFYNKARVEVKGEEKKLVSYNTHVATIKGDKAEVKGTYSTTTLRHIKEFLLQNGFKAENKKQIEKDYM